LGGQPAEWIIEEREVRRADLIVMASHHRVGVDRWLHGSVAEAVIHDAKAPVMLVKGSAANETAERFTSESPVIVVPLDQSELAEAALPIARQMAAALGARIVLVSAVPVQAPLAVGYPEMVVTYSDTDYARVEADTREYLRTIVGRINARGVQVEAVVRMGDAGLEIASTAQQYAAAAVVMATHGRTGVVRSMLGSVAGAVVQSGTTPVILLRPDRAQPAFAAQKAQETQTSVA
jgi:nucleotide-binding universal stress UspA family protein